MLSGSSLRACAELCGVSLKTSWFMRMRLCEVMERAAQPFRTGEAVSWQVDGTYLGESLKGNRSRSVAGMPRGAHRHGGAVHERGISSLKVCVVCGANDLGDSFRRLAELEASLGAWALAGASPPAGTRATRASCPAWAPPPTRQGRQGRPPARSAWSTPCTSASGGSSAVSRACPPGASGTTRLGRAGQALRSGRGRALRARQGRPALHATTPLGYREQLGAMSTAV